MSILQVVTSEQYLWCVHWYSGSVPLLSDQALVKMFIHMSTLVL